MRLIEWLLSQAQTPVFYGYYALACLPLSYLLAILLPKRYQRTWLINWSLFYCLALGLFIFGLLVNLVILATLYNIKPLRKTRESIQSLALPEFQTAPNPEYLNFGEGSGLKILQAKDLSQQKRKQTLLAINQLPSEMVIKINRQLLRDDTDEVRLYAQSLIEKQERQLFKMLKHFNQMLEKSVTPKGKAYVKKQIALIIWEQIFKGLINDDGLPLTLEKIKHLAEEALLQFPEDQILPLLLCSACLKESKLSEAKHWLALARTNQVSYYRIALFAADIAFRERDFNSVKANLKDLGHQGVINYEAQIAFWGRDD